MSRPARFLCMGVFVLFVASSTSGQQTGDLNFDGVINAKDIQRFVNCYLAGPSVAFGCACANTVPNTVLNPGDVAAFVNLLLTKGAGAACCELRIGGPSMACLAGQVMLTTSLSPAGGLCNWSVAGSGSGQVTLAPAGCSVTVTAVAASSTVNDVTVSLAYTSPLGAICNAQKILTVVRLVPTNIRFDYKPINTGASDGLNIRQDRDLELGEISGTVDTSLPTGNGKGDGEYNLAKSRSLPALYVANKSVKCAVRFTVQPAAIINAKIKATKTGTLFAGVAETTVAFSAGVSNPEYTEMALDANTPNKVRKDVGRLNWSASEANGMAMASCQFASTGTHTFYTVLDVPQSPWYDTEKEHPWVNALEFTILGPGGSGGAIDKTTIADAAAAVTTFVHGGHMLVYDTTSGDVSYVLSLKGRAGGCGPPAIAGTSGVFDLTKFIPRSRGRTVNCHDCAMAVTCLTTLVGAPTKYAYMNKFGYIFRTPLIGRGDCNNPFPKAGGGVIDKLCVGTGAMCDTNEAACVSDCTSPKRRSYGNHGFCTMSVKVLDACVGPHTGTETPAMYTTASIDSSTATEGAQAATTANICSDSVITVQ